MTDSNNPSATPHEDDLDQQTGGYEGQKGYGSQWQQGRYTDETVADSGGDVDDRAGSYESGYAAPDRDEALDAVPPTDPIGPDSTNNYASGNDLQAADAVAEEE